MKILIAPDKFKSSLSAHQVSEIISRNLSALGHEVIICPLADGGEGTAAILTQLSEGSMATVMVSDPLLRNISASYGLSADHSTAFIEMAQASGLWRLGKDEYNPEKSTTLGTGELIRHALDSGVKKIILGCGGSATNDGGTGMAAALGWKFYDRNDQEFVPTGGNLNEIIRIDDASIHPRIHQTTFTVISDVTNPLTGPEGAASVFGPQKGADPVVVKKLDEGLLHLDDLFVRYSGKSFDCLPGSGAGGGMGGGARFFLKAEWEQGIIFLIRAAGLEKKIISSDLVITGEGKLDRQSFQGKVISGVADICKKHNRRLMIICGINELEDEALVSLGAERILSLTALAGNPAESFSRPEFWIGKAISEHFY